MTSTDNGAPTVRSHTTNRQEDQVRPIAPTVTALEAAGVPVAGSGSAIADPLPQASESELAALFANRPHVSDELLTWKDEGLCAQTDPNLFFPEKGGDDRRPKLICEQCPVTAKCRDYALATNEPYGIWGGLTARQRQRLIAAQRQERRRAAAAAA